MSDRSNLREYDPSKDKHSKCYHTSPPKPRPNTPRNSQNTPRNVPKKVIGKDKRNKFNDIWAEVCNQVSLAEKRNEGKE